MSGKRGRIATNLAVLCLAAAWVSCANAVWAQMPTAIVGPPVPAAAMDRPGLGASTAGCTLDEHCDDANACTADTCDNGLCINDAIVGCIPCQSGQVCPPLEVVVVIDTSGSMVDEASSLCQNLNALIDTLALGGVNVHATLLGITEEPTKIFSCVSGNVIQQFGAAVPGDPGACTFPNAASSPESWGPATAIVAERYPWTPGSIRLVVPVGDEGPCAGSLPDGCNDPGNDRDSVDNAIAIAQSHGVIVSPILGTGADACTISLASAIAAETGGVALQSAQAKTGLLTELTRILTAACVSSDECSDGDACTLDDHCEEGVCIGTPVNGCRRCLFGVDCRDTNACTTDECLSGVCVNRAIPNCTRCTRSSDCNDSNACTTNLCDRGACAYEPTFLAGVECCDPRTGSVLLIPDGNDCSMETCNSMTGAVSRTQSSPGSACDDGADCTRNDACNAEGRCIGHDLLATECDRDADCSPSLCDFETGKCLCNDVPYLRLDDALPDGADCYRPGDTVVVFVVVGSGQTPVAGGQFLIQFDPQTLRFVSADPGQTADPTSPFVLELFEDASQTSAGNLFFAVGVPFVDPGTTGPAVMAVLRFTALSACRSTSLCFGDVNPHHTTLSDPTGGQVPVSLLCSRDIVIDDGPPMLTCPMSQQVNATAGELTADVHWSAPSAQDGCGSVRQSCAGHHASGGNLNGLAQTGGRLPQGRSSFECVGEDGCGNVGSCSWTVDVAPLNTVEVSVQLAPTTTSGPLHRCVEFEFFTSCGLAPTVVSLDMDFGPPFDLPGQSTRQVFNVPAGDYVCVTARDPLHTLSARAELESVNGRYVVDFSGNPAFGGNWLTGGNLDGSHAIDVLDFAVLVGQYLTRRPASTTCGTVARNADINGDGIVDQLDFSFIHASYLVQEQGACCASATASVETARSSVSVETLRELGLNDAAKADLDRDGMVDMDDLAAFMAGDRPAGFVRDGRGR